MPVAQQDQWQQDPSPGSYREASSEAAPGASGAASGEADGGISRLEAALARIAAAAGRKQDELRVAELTARAAQHEADLLAQSQALAAAEAAAAPPVTPGMTQDDLQALAARLDLMIAAVRSAIEPVAESAEPGSGP